MPFPGEMITEEPFSAIAAQNSAAMGAAPVVEAVPSGAWPPGMGPDAGDVSGLPDYLSQASSFVPPPEEEGPTLAESPLAPIGMPDLNLSVTPLPVPGVDDQPHQAIIWEQGGIHLADSMPGENLFWKVACKTGTLALSPGPGQIDVEKPLELTPSMFESLKLAFDEKAFPHVTVPETHANSVLENTGYVRKLEVVDKDDPRLPEEILAAHADDPDGTKLLMTGIEFTEPDVATRAGNGSIPDTSVGVKFNYRNKRSGKLYPAALEHVSLTPVPWVDGLSAFAKSAMLSQRPFDQDDDQVPFDGVFTSVDLAMRVTMHGDDYDEDQARTSIAALGSGDEWSWDYGVNVQRLDSEVDTDDAGTSDDASGDDDTQPETYYLLRGDYDNPPKLYGDLDDLMPAVSAQVATCLARRARNKLLDGAVAVGYSGEAGVVDLALADLSSEGRKKAAKDGHAMPDGSFPITTEEDLQNAIQAVGRASDTDKAKAHIKKRAKALGKEDALPDGWQLSQDGVQDDDTSLPGDAPAGEVPLVLSTQGDDMTVEEMLAQMTARAEAAEQRVATLEGTVALSQGELTNLSETSRIQRINQRIADLQAKKVPPSVLRRVQQVMLADKPGAVNDQGGLCLSVTMPAPEGSPEGVTEVEQEFGSVTEALDFVLSAMPTTGVFAGAEQLHESLELAQTEQHREASGKEKVDAWEKEAHPERFNEDGTRKEAVAA